MKKHIELEDWIERKYVRYDISEKSRDMNKLADFLLQKCIDDDNGRKYYITVYSYDRSKYPDPYKDKFEARYGFMPTVHFNVGDDKPFFNIEMNGITSIDEVEEYFEKFWNMLDKPYYEKD